MKKHITASIYTRGQEVWSAQHEEGDPVASENSVSVSAERSYNLGKYESLKIRVGVTVGVEDKKKIPKAADFAREAVIEEIDKTYKKVCKAQGVKRSVEE